MLNSVSADDSSEVYRGDGVAFDLHRSAVHELGTIRKAGGVGLKLLVTLPVRSFELRILEIYGE
jgi:hypothetical protein